MVTEDVVRGGVAAYVLGYRGALQELGYSERSIGAHLGLLADLGGWLERQGRGLDGLSSESLAEFLLDRRRRGVTGLVSAFGVEPLLSYLAGLGAISRRQPDPVGPAAGLLARYRAYLIGERGLNPAGVTRYERAAQLFVGSVAVEGEVDWAGLSAGDVTRFVVRECTTRGASSARNLAAGLRSFLRFLHVEGCTPVGLGKAVPPVGSWQGRSVPSGLEREDLRRLLGSCDRRSGTGRRDYAILLMLARLGLRAGEVAGMRLEDIDWRAGEIVVHGKDRRDERLPLPKDVGGALADYLRWGRPPAKSRSLFLRMLAPKQALTPTGVTSVVYRACERAGISRTGAHRLRHTAATEMLQAGASLVEVGQALRQRELRTTAIYAKVDHLSLRLLARPWPGAGA